MLQRYFFEPKETDPASSIRLLCNGDEVFPRFLSLVENAKEKLALEIYMFSNDETGQRVLHAMVQAAKRGVHVRMVYDSLGSLSTPADFFHPLIQAGGEVHEYHPVSPLRDRFNLKRRNHRKMLISDSTVIVGGLNLAQEYEKPISQGGFHDLALEISGDVVQSAWRLFEQTWKKEFERISARLEKRTSGMGDTQIIGNNHILDRWLLRRSLLYAMSQAETSIQMINPYFLPAPDLLTLFRLSIKKGCKVSVVLPVTSDVAAVDLACKIVQQRFLRRNIQIFQYPEPLHAKAILVDGKWVSIGSYNFDYQSLFRNLEVVVNTVAPQVAGRLQEIFDQDQQKSKIAIQDDWKQLAWWEKLLARVLYRLRRFL